MKNLILTFLILISTIVFSQDAEQVRINEIDEKIKTAITNEDYALAAKLKEEKEYRLKIKTAVDNGDYEEAAKIKKELEAFMEGKDVNENSSDIKPSVTPNKISVADLNLKVGSMQSEEFLYGFAKGDKIILSFTEETGKELKEIEVHKYSGSSKFQSFKISSISEKIIEVQETGIFVFRFSNGSISKRVCDIKLARIPAKEETAKFNTAVYWKTVYDTTYYTEDEKYLISKDTVIHNITDQTAKVHSSTNLNGNKTSFNFSLPRNTVSWSYYVGVNQAGQKALEDASAVLAEKAAPLVSKIPGYGPLAALALGSTSYITKLQSGEDIDFYIVDGNNVNLFLGGSAFRYYKKGKVINDFSKMSKPLKGSYHFCFMNDNAITGVTVVVKITAISVTENWGKRPVEKMKVDSREIPYLKN